MTFEKDKIVLGDAYELIKQIPDKSIDLIVTDPPYDIGTIGAGSFGVKNRNFLTEVNEANIANGFDLKILDAMVRVCKIPNIYLFCNKSQLRSYFDYFQSSKGFIVDLLIWKKTNPVPMISSNYLNDVEYLFYAKKSGAPFFGTYETGSKVFETTTNKVDKDLYDHPTIKPLKIIRNLIVNSSKEGDLVLDPFLGSGTTAVACKELGRHYLGFEINKRYYETAVGRIAGITQRDEESGYVQDKLF